MFGSGSLRVLSWLAIALGWLVLSGCDSASPEAPAKTRRLPLPTGFVEDSITGPWTQPVGITFAANGRMFVWEKAGKLWEVTGNAKNATPLLDISEEVGNWRDFGMLGLALDPNFLTNGYIYALYVVDYHHLANFGTAAYNSATDTYFHDTIGRLVRYTARSSDNFTSVDYTSRLVLLGESMSTGCPILHQSHGVGSLAFGQDGTLLLTCGDGASYSVTDTGGTISGSSNTGLADGIITPKENVGSFRAQLVDSLSGKALRLDPATGDGVPGNPFYDPSAPRSARSRVWALGLRNPFRMTHRPDTGSHLPADGDPGSLYIGDVGWNTWEELNIARTPGQNFGWPAYEGLTAQSSYTAASTANQDAPNPLDGTTPPGQPLCNKPYFFFKDLLVQDTLNTPSFPNSCDPSQQIPASLARFEHWRPALAWHHSNTETRVGDYNTSGSAITFRLSSASSPVTGAEFRGSASVGGVWYTGTDFPPQYRNTYFHADYVRRWIKYLVFDDQDRLISVNDFAPNDTADVVALATHPVAGGLYYIDYDNEVHRVRFESVTGQPPIASAQADVRYGASPLTVQFSSAGSSDPEGGTLTFSWNFGDGSPTVAQANPSHTFTATGPQSFNVVLTVSDPAGNSRTASLVLSVNNTAPAVTITNPRDGGIYSMTGPSSIALTADLSDAEQSVSALTCAWEVTLHHDTHSHPEPAGSTCASTAQLTPIGCGEQVYFYTFRLQVSDGLGAPVERTATLYPDCSPVPIAPNGPIAGSPTFVWRPVMGADAYELVVDDAVTAGKIVQIYTPSQAGCTGASDECSATPSGSLASGTARFRVRARNPVDGWRAFGPNMEFVVPGPPPAPTLLSPNGSGAPSTPTYRWNALAGATDYMLWVDSPAGAGVIKTWFTSAVCSAGQCAVTPTTALPPGTSKWWVLAKNGAGSGPWSVAMTFSVGVLTPPGISTPLSPLGTITTATPAFQWTSVSGAAEYLLWVNDVTGNRHRSWYSAAAAGCATGPTCSLSPGITLSVGSASFWIQARNGAGPGSWSSAGSFTIAASGGVPTTGPTLTAPSGPQSDTTPAYQWNAVANATSYYLWVDGPSGNVVRTVYSAAQTNCASSSECSITPGTALALGSYKWWVQAQTSSGSSPWSAAMQFVVQ
jgi:glucose/arabinose dehydrogenase/PKD repeat protein